MEPKDTKSKETKEQTTETGLTQEQLQALLEQAAEAGAVKALKAMTPEEDQRLGCIGHVRMDFGHRGQEFWHTWWPRGPEELNSPEFKAELQEVVDELRTSVLKDLAGMTKYCWGHGGEVGGWPANYGYIV